MGGASVWRITAGHDFLMKWPYAPVPTDGFCVTFDEMLADGAAPSWAVLTKNAPIVAATNPWKGPNQIFD